MEKEYDITLADVPTVCRTCLRKKHDMKDIFEASADKLLFNAYSITISKEDGLSQLICQSCIRRATDASSFKELCTQSDQMVRGLLNVFTVDHTYSSHLASAEYASDSDHDNSELFIAETEDQEQSTEQTEQKTAFLGNIELSAKNTDHVKSPRNDENEAFSPDKNSGLDKDKRKVMFAQDVANNVKTAKRKMIETGNREVDASDDPDFPARPAKRRKSMNHRKLKSNRQTRSTEKTENNEKSPEHESAEQEIIPTSAIVEEPVEVEDYTGDAYLCEVCYERFTDLELYRKHCDDHKKRKYKCGCGKIFDKFREFKSHRLIHYTREGKRQFRCTICLRVYATNHGLFTHMEKCFAGKVEEQQPKPIDPYLEHLQSKTCFICDAKFKVTRMLNKHLREVHDRNPLACKICDRVFVRFDVLVEHIQVHTGQKPFKCPRCYKKVRNRNNLKAHMKIIHGETLLSSRRRSRKDKQSSQNAATSPEEPKKSPKKQIDRTRGREKGRTSKSTDKCTKNVTTTNATTASNLEIGVKKSPPSDKQKTSNTTDKCPKNITTSNTTTTAAALKLKICVKKSPPSDEQKTPNDTIKKCPESVTTSKTTTPELKKPAMKSPPSEKQKVPVKDQQCSETLPKTLREPEKQTAGSVTNGKEKTPDKKDKCTKNMIPGAEAPKPNQQVRTISSFDKQRWPYKCLKCSKRFKSIQKWKLHNRHAHASGEGCKSSVCGEPLAQPTPFACKICFKKFTTSSELREHTAKHGKKAVSEQKISGSDTGRKPTIQIQKHIIFKSSSTVNEFNKRNNSETPAGHSNSSPKKTTSKNSTKENSSLKEDSCAKGCTKNSTDVEISVQQKPANKQDSQPETRTAEQVATKDLVGENIVKQNSVKLDFSKNQVYAVRDHIKNQYFLLMYTKTNSSGTVLPFNQIIVKPSGNKSTDGNSIGADANKNSSEAESLSKQITTEKKSSKDRPTEDNTSAMAGADKNFAEKEQKPQK